MMKNCNFERQFGREGIEKIAENLRFSAEEECWICDDITNISYPEEGHKYCFEIEENSFWFKHRNKVIVEILSKFPAPGTLYDVGGGNGYVAWELSNNGFEVVLVEPFLPACRNAKARGLSSIICGEFEKAGFRDGVLPAVGLFDVIEHIKDELFFLKGVKKKLMKGGRIYITVPAYEVLWSFEDIAALHFRRYHLKDLCQKLENIGYTIEYATYFFSFLFLPIFFLRTLPSKLKLRNKSTFEVNQREHVIKNTKIEKIIEWFCKRELFKIKNGRKISLGTSCVVVARG
jgi:SAM-dependent methyltransferase